MNLTEVFKKIEMALALQKMLLQKYRKRLRLKWLQ